jgi:hypothetical protein
MSIKKFFLKQALKWKGGVSGDQAEKMAEMFDKNPEMVSALKTIEDNPEIKSLFEKIQKDMEEQVKKGAHESILAQTIMIKYQKELAKYGPELMPLFQMMQKMQ